MLDPGGFGGVTITKSITINGTDNRQGSSSPAPTASRSTPASMMSLRLRHLQINGLGTGLAGIRFNTGATLIVDDVFVQGFQTGVETHAGDTIVDHSLITRNSLFGVHALGGTLTVENSMVASNHVAAQASTPGTLRLSNNGVYNNQTGFGCGGGTLASAGNNRKAGNSGGVVLVCAPTVAITLQ